MRGFNALTRWAERATFAHVAFAFVTMGGWAAFINREHQFAHALSAGLLQGFLSGLITLLMKKFLEWSNTRLSRPLALFVPPVTSASVILAILFIAHSVVGTPEILATIALPFTISTSYAVIYNWRLWRYAHGR